MGSLSNFIGCIHIQCLDHKTLTVTWQNNLSVNIKLCQSTYLSPNGVDEHHQDRELQVFVSVKVEQGRWSFSAFKKEKRNWGPQSRYTDSVGYSPKQLFQKETERTRNKISHYTYFVLTKCQVGSWKPVWVMRYFVLSVFVFKSNPQYAHITVHILKVLNNLLPF